MEFHLQRHLLENNDGFCGCSHTSSLFNTSLDYVSGHVADTQEKCTTEYISFIMHTSVPKAMTVEEIVSATKNDCTLQCVRDAIRPGTWDSPALKHFCYMKDVLKVGT